MSQKTLISFYQKKQKRDKDRISSLLREGEREGERGEEKGGEREETDEEILFEGQSLPLI